jgi:hypothetical protein
MDKAIEEAANRIEVSVKCLVWKCCIYIWWCSAMFNMQFNIKIQILQISLCK